MTQQRLLIQQVKGYSFRLLDVETGKRYRAIKTEFPDLAVGALLLVENLVTTADLIESMDFILAVKGDTSKPRVEINVEETALGDLIDGVPALRFGSTFYKQGEKRAYAYFSSAK